MTDSVEARALTWSLGRDTGLSSQSIAGFMTGRGPNRWNRYDHPHDGDDLGRCIRLLALIPEWRPRLSEMGKVSLEWGALAKHWDELEDMYSEAIACDEKQLRTAKAKWQALYDRMRAILDPIRAKNP